jgi:cellobiose phosphorylase
MVDGTRFTPTVSPFFVYAAPEFEHHELHQWFPHRHSEEFDGDTLLSFFLPDHQHVVLPSKEVRVERPHGSIIVTGNNNYLKRDELASTTYMYGVFGSQVVTGNSSFTRLTSNTRNPLNVQKISGMRMFVKQEGAYRLLTMPSAYEMGLNYAKWYYKWDDDVLVITSLTTVDTPELILTFESHLHRHYDVLVSQMLVLGETEYTNTIQVLTEDDHIHFKPVGKTFTTERIPNFGYDLYSDHAYTMHHDGLFSATHQPQGEPVFSLEYHQVAHLRLTWVGYGGDYLVSLEPRSVEQHIHQYLEFYKKNVNGFALHHADHKVQAELTKLNDLVYWYTNNALVHYSSPHGLEQYNGAAWGLRDVCQGPV